MENCYFEQVPLVYYGDLRIRVWVWRLFSKSSFSLLRQYNVDHFLSWFGLQSKKALTNILQKCVHLPALEPLLKDAPPNILKHVVSQFAKVLPHDAAARKLFVTSGGLRKVQEINAERNSALSEHINSINNCYPEEIVRSVKNLTVEFVTMLFELFPKLIRFTNLQWKATTITKKMGVPRTLPYFYWLEIFLNLFEVRFPELLLMPYYVCIWDMPSELTFSLLF